MLTRFLSETLKQASWKIVIIFRLCKHNVFNIFLPQLEARSENINKNLWVVSVAPKLYFFSKALHGKLYPAFANANH